MDTFRAGDIVTRREPAATMRGTVVKVIDLATLQGNKPGTWTHSGGGTCHVRVRWTNGQERTLADTQLRKVTESPEAPVCGRCNREIRDADAPCRRPPVNHRGIPCRPKDGRPSPDTCEKHDVLGGGCSCRGGSR